MLIDHLKSPDLETKEKFLLSVYYLGMADRIQLSTLLGIEPQSVDTIIKRWNRRAEKEKKERYVVSLSAPFTKGSKLYQLGPSGWKWVMAWIHDNRPYYERSDAQKRHYRGMTDILVRLMKKVSLDQIRYHNTFEAGELFQYPWVVANHGLEEKELEKVLSLLPEPDLLVGVGKKEAWVEYDTGAESQIIIQGKDRRYYRAYNQLKLDSQSRKPVLWIAQTKARAERLKMWAEMVKKENEFRERRFPLPEMYFLVEGEEVDYFLPDRKEENDVPSIPIEANGKNSE